MTGLRGIAGARQPLLLAVSGVKNSGKTTLIEGLLPYLTARGLKIAVIKHDGHDFEPDVPGTDSFRYRKGGAFGTAVFSGKRLMVVKETARPAGEEALAACFPEADLILLEGFKYSGHLKIELARRGNSAAFVSDGRSLGAAVSDMNPLELGGYAGGRRLFVPSAGEIKKEAARTAAAFFTDGLLSGPVPLFHMNDLQGIGTWMYELYRRVLESRSCTGQNPGF